MATDRPFGRIRLWEQQADYLSWLLKLERDRVTLQRKMHKEQGTNPFNRQIHFIDQMLEEVERTRQEMGWRSTNEDPKQVLDSGS